MLPVNVFPNTSIPPQERSLIDVYEDPNRLILFLFLILMALDSIIAELLMN